MKLILTLSLTLTVMASANSYSQEKYVSLDMENATLMEILQKIEEVSEFGFLFRTNDIDLNQRYNVHSTNILVEDLLTEIFAGESVHFQIKDRNIIISKVKEENPVQNSLQKEIKGKVTDTDGNPLPGITVVIKGTQLGNITDSEGCFRISNGPTDGILIFSFVGMKTQEVSFSSGKTLNVIMISDILRLEEIVVIGYGTQSKELVTSAISSIKEDAFIKGTVRSPLQLIQGKVAGLVISTPGGDPVSNPQVNIRGISTLASSSDPLIVIDGIPGGSLYSIAPEDIESIDVLKDGSAAAIYGSRANGGVIIVTTKRAQKDNALTINYNGYYSLDQPQKITDVFSAEEYLQLRETTGMSSLSLANYKSSTDWQNEILRTPINQVHNLTLHGGNEKSNIVASTSYRNQDGILLNSGRQSIISRIDMQHSALNDKLKVNLRFSDNLSTQKEIWYNSYLSSITRNPTLAIYTDDGNFTEFPNMTLNPVAQLTTESKIDRWNQLLMSGKITVTPVKNLNLSALLAVQRFDDQFDVSNDFRNQSTTIGKLNGEVLKTGNQYIDRTLDVTSDYKFSINNTHNFNTLLGYSYQDFSRQGYNMYAWDFPTDIFGPWNIGASYSIIEGKSQMGSYKNESRMVAFFSRINYDLGGKYLFMLSLRREGSSKFGQNHKWGWFPGLNIGWIISKEPFFQDIAFIDNLKLRMGYGITGTQPNDPYLSLSLLQFTGRMYYGGRWIPGVEPASNPNPDLRWERKEEVNFGIDFAMFDRRIDGSLDLYRRNTKDLLYTYNVPVPPNLFNTIFANVGNIINSGIEFTINTILVKNSQFNWTAGTTFAYNHNKLSKFSNDSYELDYLNIGQTGSPIQTYTHRLQEGVEIGNFYGFKSVGIDEKGDWLVLNRDGEEISINDAGDGDKHVLGNGIPKIYAGLSTSFNYGAFDISLSLRGAFVYQILNQYRMHYETFARTAGWNLPKSVLNKPYGAENYIKAGPKYVSYYIENGDYIKIDNISFGYTIPINKNLVKNARIYVASNNLYTFTGYSGLDPEVSIKGLDPGIDYMEKYPSTRTMMLGINLSF